MESVVFDRLGSRDLWQTILETLSDRDERLVIYLSFVQGMKPAEIATSRAGDFASIADVYRIKRNAIERLRAPPASWPGWARRRLPSLRHLAPWPPEALPAPGPAIG